MFSLFPRSQRDELSPRHRAMRRRFIVGGIATVTSLVAVATGWIPASAFSPVYLTPFTGGSASVIDINDNLTPSLAGNSAGTSVPSHATFWASDTSSPVDIGDLSDGTLTSTAQAISDNDQVVGYSLTGPGSGIVYVNPVRPFSWSGGTITQLSTGANTTYGAARAVNSAGTVTGQWIWRRSIDNPCVWEGSSFTRTDLPKIVGMDIWGDAVGVSEETEGDDKVVVGYLIGDGAGGGVYWKKTSGTWSVNTLGLLSGGTTCRAYAISKNATYIVGTADDVNGITQAVVWTANGSGGYGPPVAYQDYNGNGAIAYDVNNNGDVVGSDITGTIALMFHTSGPATTTVNGFYNYKAINDVNTKAANGPSGGATE
jgi:uncharacterized membrane protein